MTRSVKDAVVVAHDGSARSDAALEWAAREAVLKDRPLLLLHAWQPPTPSTTAPRPEKRDSGLDHAAERVRHIAPALNVTQERIEGPAAMVLIEASRDADTLVLGAHGKLRRRLSDLGSTGWQVVSQASCPSVVVRNLPDRGVRRPVVVGVGGSRTSDAAVTYGFAQASRRRVSLVAVYGWRLESLRASHVVLQSDSERRVEDLARETQLDTWVQPWRERFPDVPVRLVSRMWHPADLLLEEARKAQLVVVGRRGFQPFPGLLLESVGFDVLREAPCPLAIVPKA